MNEGLAYLLLILTLGLFGWLGYRSGSERTIGDDEYLSARRSQSWLRIGLSLFASGMGIWILFGPSEVGYYGGFFDVLGYAVAAATPFLLLAFIGPLIIERLPEGVTLADYVRMRIGRPMQIYVGIISVLYMFTFLFAEFTAIGKAMSILSGMNPLVPMFAVAVVTAAYTAYGGLPASLQTDRWQAWMIIVFATALLLLIFAADIGTLITEAKAVNPEDEWSIGSMTHMGTFASGLALVVAITSAEMFSQGNWQRAYASENEGALKRGSFLAAGLVFPLVLVMGILGTVVAGRGNPMFGDVYDPSAAFFILISEAGVIIIAAFIVLVVALVCSSADTLQNAIVASVSRDLADGRMNLQHARFATIALIPIAIWLATGPSIGRFSVNATSVFAIFLFADLLATATVAPILLTLWDRVSSQGALIGAVAGLLSVVFYGAVTADFASGVSYLFSPTTEGGLANLSVFLSALIGSIVVTIGASYILTDTSTPEEE